MSVVKDLSNLSDRVKGYSNRLADLLRRHGVKADLKSLLDVIKNDQFRAEFVELMQEFADAEGGKLAMTTVAAIIGAALGGIGIAAAGTAIGIPAMVVLIPVGFLLGNEADTTGVTRSIVNGIQKRFGLDI